MAEVLAFWRFEKKENLIMTTHNNLLSEQRQQTCPARLCAGCWRRLFRCRSASMRLLISIRLTWSAFLRRQQVADIFGPLNLLMATLDFLRNRKSKLGSFFPVEREREDIGN